MVKNILEINNLYVSFHTRAGEVKALRGVDVTVEEAKTVALVGESGCGKSVTAKAVMGLLPAKQSEIKEGSSIVYDTRNLLNLSKKEMQTFCGRDCAMIFQDALSALNPTMTIGKQIIENLKNHKKMKRDEYKACAILMLQKVGIPDAEKCMKKYPLELSGGMRQRVMIASALICNPRLLIADEATTALDVTIQAQILELLKELQKKLGMSVLMITHDLGVVAKMADKIAVMYAGKIVEQADKEGLFYHPKHPYTWALLQSVPKIDDEQPGGILHTIEGNLPSLIHPPKGCVFAGRCPYCMNICRSEEPGEYICGDNHSVSCWLMEEQADRSDVRYLKEEKDGWQSTY